MKNGGLPKYIDVPENECNFAFLSCSLALNPKSVNTMCPCFVQLFSQKLWEKNNIKIK